MQGLRNREIPSICHNLTARKDSNLKNFAGSFFFRIWYNKCWINITQINRESCGAILLQHNHTEEYL